MTTRNNRSGIVDPVTLIVVAVIGIFVGGWKPLNMFKKPPPTVQLTKLQADLSAAQADAAQARKDKDAAVAAERAKHDEQLRSVQQDLVGAKTAQDRLPSDRQTTETKLAASLVASGNLKLVAILGKLPDDQQAVMVDLIDKALSGKQAEVDAANAELAQREADFKKLTAEHAQTVTQLQANQATVATKDQQLAAVQTKVTAATNDVKTWADKTDAALRQAGGFAANFKRALAALALLVGLWFFLAYVLPGIVKHLNSGTLKNALRDVSGYATSGLLYHDARKKIAALQAAAPTTTVTPDSKPLP